MRFPNFVFSFLALVACGHASTIKFKQMYQGGVTAPDTENGRKEGRYTGAVHDISFLSKDVAFVAAINRGVFKTDNFLADEPTWSEVPIRFTSSKKVLETFSSSVSAVHAESSNVIVVGAGAVSNFASVASTLSGVALSTDGGKKWVRLGLQGQTVVGVRSLNSGAAVFACTNKGFFKFTNAKPVAIVSGQCLAMATSSDNDVVALFNNKLAVAWGGGGESTFELKGLSDQDEINGGKIVFQEIKAQKSLIAFLTTEKGPGNFLFLDQLGKDTEMGDIKVNSGFLAEDDEGELLGGVVSSQGDINTALWPHPTKQGHVIFCATAGGDNWGEEMEKKLGTEASALLVAGDVRAPTDWELGQVSATSMFHADCRNFGGFGNMVATVNDGGVWAAEDWWDYQTVKYKNKNSNLPNFEASTAQYDSKSRVAVVALQDNGCIVTDGTKHNHYNEGDGGIAGFTREFDASDQWKKTNFWVAAQQADPLAAIDSTAKVLGEVEGSPGFFVNYMPYIDGKKTAYVSTKGSGGGGALFLVNGVDENEWEECELENIDEDVEDVMLKYVSGKIYYSANHALYSVDTESCKETEVAKLQDAFVASFCVNPVDTKKVVIIDKRGKTSFHSTGTTKSVGRGHAAMDCAWISLGDGDGELHMVLATKAGAYISQTDELKQFTLLTMGLGNPSHTVFTEVKFVENHMVLTGLGYPVSVLENAKEALEAVMEINRFSARYTNETDQFVLAFTEDVAVKEDEFAVLDSDGEEVDGWTVKVNESRVIFDLSGAKLEEGVAYRVMGTYCSIYSPTSDLCVSKDAANSHESGKSDELSLGYFRYGNDTEANPATAPVVGDLTLSKEDYTATVTWTPGALGGCVFIYWEILVVLADGEEFEIYDDEVEEDQNLYDSTETTATFEMDFSGSFKVDVSAVCALAGNDSSRGSSKSVVAPDQPSEGADHITVKGTTKDSVSISWKGGYTNDCEPAGWEFELRDPKTLEPFKVTKVTIDEEKETAVLGGLKPSTYYAYVRMRELCTDPSLNSQWTYSHAKADSAKEKRFPNTLTDPAAGDDKSKNDKDKDGYSSGHISQPNPSSLLVALFIFFVAF